MVLDDNNKAWTLLTEEEQLAVSLQYGHSKSSWEAGEIMGKAHYKYLEIVQRASYFLKRFNEHTVLYDEILPDYINVEPEFRQYLQLVILDRKTVKEATLQIDKPFFSVRSSREEFIVKQIMRLKRSRYISDQAMVDLILDFDRWNNYRILPREIPEPSAFKRRQKNDDKKNIRHVMKMNEYSCMKIKEIYHFKTKVKNAKYYYFVLFGKHLKTHIIPCRTKPKISNELAKLGIYVFKKKSRAKDYYKLLSNYDIDKHKHCTEGQKFWPNYRKYISYAINKNKILKVIPSRKHLEVALSNIGNNL